MYWSNNGYVQNVWMVPLAGGTPLALRTGVSGGWGIALDADSVFYGGFDYYGGFVAKLARTTTCAPP